MVTMELSDQDIALINAAEHHRTTCRKCSKATTVSPRSTICLAGLLHYSKIMRMFRMNPALRTAVLAQRNLETP